MALTYIPGPDDLTITAPDGSRWTSVRPRFTGGKIVRPGGILVALARLETARLERATVAAAAERAAARLAARNAARLADVAAVRARCDRDRIRRHALAADRRELARLELVAAAALADAELAADGRNDSDGGTDGWKPPTRRELELAAEVARRNVERARLAMVREWNTAAAPARQAALAAEYDGTTAGRSERRAAIHQARQAAPLSNGHRAALAAQLADGCRTYAWAGNGDAPQYPRERAVRELVTESAWNRAVIVGTDARTGTVSRTPGGTVYGAVTRPIEPVLRTVRPDDLTHYQHGRAIVLAGAATGLARDASRDELADAIRCQAAGTTRPVAGGGDTAWRADGRSGQVALARAGWAGLEAWKYGTELIAADDRARAAAERAAAAAPAATDAPAPAIHAPAACGACGKIHAAIVACGDV
ncbi:MAG: hypothetical protein ACKODT_07030 [Fluviibacter sp.]